MCNSYLFILLEIESQCVETDRATLRSQVLPNLAEGLLGSHLGVLLLNRNCMYENSKSFISLTSMCQC